MSFACGQNENKQTTELNIKENTEIIEASERLKTGMIEFMESGDVGYKLSDVEKCISLIDIFLTEMSKSNSKKDGMLSVQNVVIGLNDLNEACDYQLIETSERENIADIIILSGHLKGFNERDEDITEEWREW
jgi:hypothetical protein